MIALLVTIYLIVGLIIGFLSIRTSFFREDRKRESEQEHYSREFKEAFFFGFLLWPFTVPFLLLIFATMFIHSAIKSFGDFIGAKLGPRIITAIRGKE